MYKLFLIIRSLEYFYRVGYQISLKLLIKFLKSFSNHLEIAILSQSVLDVEFQRWQEFMVGLLFFKKWKTVDSFLGFYYSIQPLSKKSFSVRRTISISLSLFEFSLSLTFHVYTLYMAKIIQK